MRYTDYFGVQQNLGIQPDLGLLPNYGYLSDLGIYGWSPTYLYANNEQGLWYDPSDLTTEKTAWRRNLLTYSQDFENAAWTKSNASLLSNLALYSQEFDNAAWGAIGSVTTTANAIAAPDGTTTADLITASAAGPASAGKGQTVTFTGDGEKTFSVYLKVGDGSVSTVAVFDSTAATMRHQVRVTWTAGVPSLTSLIGAGTLFPVQSVGDGWYRIAISATGVVAANSNSVRVYVNNVAAAVTGNSVYVWGAQAENAITPGTYTRSLATAAPVMFSDPLGGTMADKLVENTAAANHLVSWSTTLLAGVTYTLSAYAKAGERTQFAVQTSNVGNWASSVLTIFNLDTGTIASGSGTITPVGSGWYRCSITATFGAANATGGINILPASAGLVTYTGDGVSGVYIFGAQVEQASTASAYQRITDFTSDFLAAFPTHALYTESTFTTPVTALGQSVGGVVDKRLGGLSTLGTEVVSNGDFSNGFTGWGSPAQWIIDSGQARKIPGVAETLSTSVSLVAGVSYLVTFTVSNRSVGNVAARFSGGTTVSGSSFSQNGRYYNILTAVTGNTTLGITNSSDFDGFIDNVSVRAVPGNHAIQGTLTSRPTLQARANLLTGSEQFDIWNDSTPTCTVTANAIVAPDGTTTADLLTATGTGSYRSRSVTYTGDGEKAFSFYVKEGTSSQGSITVYDGTAAVSRHIVRVTWTAGVPSLATFVGSGTLFPVETIGSGWYRIKFTATGIVAANSNVLLFYPNNTGAGIGSMYVWGAQAENATTVSTYQRVVTATDYADVGLPRNLLFDGIDDSLATTGNVDFTATDKVSVFSGLTKNSDAAIGMVVELSSTIATNNGTFYITSPNAAASANCAFSSKGTTQVSQTVASTAPDTAVITGLGDISAPSATARRNGVAGTTTATQGTGTYLSYPLYIGRRNNSLLPFNGRIFQLIVRGAATDSVTVTNAEQYVAQKTGVTL
jgi:hypothetical protein